MLQGAGKNKRAINMKKDPPVASHRSFTPKENGIIMKTGGRICINRRVSGADLLVPRSTTDR